MNYQEKVSTRAEVRALYEKVKADPTIACYRGYTATKSYGWSEDVGDYIKRDGEAWFENPAYDPARVSAASEEQPELELLDEQLEKSLHRIEDLEEEKSELCRVIDALDARIAEYEETVSRVTGERDEALQALAALREALAAIRKLTEVA